LKDSFENASVKKVMMEIIRGKFGGLAFWSKIEPDIALHCADLPEPITEDKKKEFIKQLVQIKVYLLGRGIVKDELEFFDEEIKRYELTKEISLYEEEDDEVKPEVIEKYARLGAGTEGIIGIHHPYTYTQMSRLTNGVFKKTGLIKFYISRERTIYGKITAEIYEHSQKIPIATLVESKKKTETGEAMYTKILLFGETGEKNKIQKIREITLPFYVYRFISENNQDMILMSTTKCEIGDYIITGVVTECNDYKMLTESAKLPTKLPFFFAQFVRSRIIKFRDAEDLFSRAYQLGICRKSFYDYPFSTSRNNVSYKLLQPEWYKQLIWAWLLHQPKGIMNNYPLHLMVIGPKASGKSLLLNSLHSKSKETRSIFSGSSSTLKFLIPSFKNKPAQLGYLAESNRFAFCDEFLRCLANTSTSTDNRASARDESVALMNDLLEHQKREAGSGVSRISVINMTARILATTNPIRGINNVKNMVNAYDESFLSRWMIYYQTQGHVDMIRNSDDFDLEVYDFKIPVTDWISIVDYLQSFSAKYDMSKVLEIFKQVPQLLSETLLRHYSARHKHHIECLIDGIIKTRCLLDGDLSFKARDVDYKVLKSVWSMLVSSWVDFSKIKEMDIKERVHYIPEPAQHLYWLIVNEKKQLGREEVKTLALKGMKNSEFLDAWAILADNGLILEWENTVRPYFMKYQREEI